MELGEGRGGFQLHTTAFGKGTEVAYPRVGPVSLPPLFLYDYG